MIVLGVVPGAQTGLALVRIGPAPPYAVLDVREVPQTEAPHVIERLATQAERVCVAVHDVRPRAPARDAITQAEAFGFIRGVLAMFRKPFVPVPRTQVCLALTGHPTAQTPRLIRALFPSLGISARRRAAVEIDALALAIVGSGRPLTGGLECSTMTAGGR